MRDYIAAGIILTLIHFASFVYIEFIHGEGIYGTVVYEAGRAVAVNDNNRYFLSFDNISFYYFIPVIVLLFYYSIYYNRQAYKYFLLYSFVVLFMFAWKTSATCLVASLFLVLSLLGKKFCVHHSASYCWAWHAGLISYFVTASMDWRYNTLVPWAVMVFGYYASKAKR